MSLSEENLRELEILQDLIELGHRNEYHNIEIYFKNAQITPSEVIELFNKYPNAYRSNEQSNDSINQIRIDIAAILEDLKDKNFPKLI